MTVFGHPLCFLNCHLPAHMRNLEQRMEDFESILQQQQFEGGAATGVLDHEWVTFDLFRVFFFFFNLQVARAQTWAECHPPVDRSISVHVFLKQWFPERFCTEDRSVSLSCYCGPIIPERFFTVSYHGSVPNGL